MPAWLKDGLLNGYRRLSMSPGEYTGISAFSVDGALFASPGSVDVQMVSRFQYNVTPDYGIGAQAGFSYSAADVAALPAGKVMGATMFFAPASAFAPNVVPTPGAIGIAATKVVRPVDPGGGLLYYRTTAGDLDNLYFFGPPPQAWAPNEKWWVLLVPTYYALASTPSITNDTPIGGAGAANANGRALSFWTNRTPNAPVITSPVGQVVTFPGSEITLTFSSRDPDDISSMPRDLFQNGFDDLAGVQVQYAPWPTEEDPTPVWTDMPIADGYAAVLGRGWYIDRQIDALPADGAGEFWNMRTMKIRCGSTTLKPYAGMLPSGNWQVRMRTFDYGHPFPNPVGGGGAPSLRPLGDASGTYTADTYPAANTSPWSVPVKILVTDQVPPPVPIYPINAVAVVAGQPITLTWQYRNTYYPPYAQASRTVQIRKVGDPAWITLSAGADSSNSLVVDGGLFTFEASTHYEWRVQVTDADGVVSAYSAVGRFWVVPAPQSGEVRPLPVSTIDGATLGCGTHRVLVFRRGGKRYVGEITSLVKVEWGRTRDDISTAKIKVADWGVDCGKLLARIKTWAYEIVIMRDNGFSVDRVWEGPITLLTYETDTAVTIDAKDVMAYPYRRIIKQAMSDAKDGATVTSRAAQVLFNALAPDDPNLLAYMHVLAQADDAKQYRSTPAYSRTAFEEIDDMAANAGLDYVAVGRSIILWGTKHRIGTIPELRDKDLGSPPIVSEYGMSYSNRYVVSDGNGVWGEATRLDVSGNDEDTGLVEMLSSTWASDAEAETGTYTEEGRDKVVKSFEDAAERSIASRYPQPVVVRVPDNTTLNPGTVLSIQHLIPGVVVPLRSTGTLRVVVADQKLDSVKVIEEAGKERISITMSPFDDSDEEIEEGEE